MWSSDELVSRHGISDRIIDNHTRKHWTTNNFRPTLMDISCDLVIIIHNNETLRRMYRTLNIRYIVSADPSGVTGV